MLGLPPSCSDTPVFDLIKLAMFSIASMHSGCCCNRSNSGFSLCHPRASHGDSGASDAEEAELDENGLSVRTSDVGKRAPAVYGEAELGPAIGAAGIQKTPVVARVRKKLREARVALFIV